MLVYHGLMIFTILSKATFSTKHCKYVRPTTTTILECPYRSEGEDVVQWLYSNSTNRTFLTISDNNDINNIFMSNHSFVILSNRTDGGFYDLQISNVTTADEGIYRCTYRNETIHQPEIVLCLMRAPDNWTVINMSSNNTIYGVEDEKLTLACVSKGGKPIGNISWHNGTKMLASSNENMEWSNCSFILNRYHDGQILNCSVQHDMLDSPRNIPVKLNVQWQARIPRSIKNSDRLNVLPMIIYIIVCSCVVVVVGISTKIYSCIKADKVKIVHKKEQKLKPVTLEDVQNITEQEYDGYTEIDL